MKKYISLFRIRFINGLQYRAAALAGIATQFFWGFMEILLFKAFYESNPTQIPMEFNQLASYIWLQQAFLALFASWTLDNDIFKIISDGNIAYELARPANLYDLWFSKNLALRVSNASMRCLAILIVAWFLPEPYRLTPPPNFLTFILFLITLILGLFVVVGFCMFVYIASFHTLNPMGIRLVAIGLTDLLSGSVIPFPFFPRAIQKVLELLPFGSIQNVPLRIYTGNISGNEIFPTIILQIVWVIVLVFLGKLWMNSSLKKIVVQGG